MIRSAECLRPPQTREPLSEAAELAVQLLALSRGAKSHVIWKRSGSFHDTYIAEKRKGGNPVLQGTSLWINFNIVDNHITLSVAIKSQTSPDSIENHTKFPDDPEYGLFSELYGLVKEQNKNYNPARLLVDQLRKM